MSTRRSSRARTRGSDSGAEPDTTNDSKTAAPPAAKRARKSKDETVASDAKSNACDWLHQTLAQDKRAAWDAILKTHYFLHKPHELYDLFELAVHLCPKAPLEAFITTAGIRLCGPFDLLARHGSTVRSTKPLYLHGRFFLDPPEVVAVLEDTKSDAGAHWGLYRDTPSASPSYVVFTRDANVCAFEVVAQSLFSVLHTRLESGQTDDAAAQLRLVQSYIEQHSDSCAKSTSSVRSQRANETLANSLHGLGIVVPYDAKKRNGYRELPTTGDDLRDLIASVQSGDAGAKKKLTNLVTRATIANDECDFGTSLLLGLDLFTAGSALQKQSLQLLRVAYMLLGRKDFAKVASDHVKHRTEGLAPVTCLVESDGETTTTLDLP